jgi:hypothetical protein
MRVSVETLRDLGACHDQVRMFKDFLGGRKYCLFSDKNIHAAVKFGLDVEWFVRAAKLTVDIPVDPVRWPNLYFRYENGRFKYYFSKAPLFLVA